MNDTDKISQIFDFLKISENLKKTRRWKNTPGMKRKETSADHSWHLALLVILATNELGIKIDTLKSIEMALVHDLVEAITDDYEATLILLGQRTQKQKHDEELAAIKKIKATLPSESGNKFYNLWQEYEKTKTPEAKFVRALDKIESINHMLVLKHKCFDHPEFVAPFPNESTRNFPESIPLLKELQKRLKPEYKKHGWEWKKEYDV